MTDEEREVTSIRIRPDIWKKAKHEAINRDIAVAELVETALIRELNIKEPKIKEPKVS